ncbi:hypothetical protein BC826DRAFT_971267 [Russula brevipes]|nr:hypothetical protein BC826DRAFT_971267 [Russula brevipes]
MHGSHPNQIHKWAWRFFVFASGDMAVALYRSYNYITVPQTLRQASYRLLVHPPSASSHPGFTATVTVGVGGGVLYGRDSVVGGNLARNWWTTRRANDTPVHGLRLPAYPSSVTYGEPCQAQYGAPTCLECGDSLAGKGLRHLQLQYERPARREEGKRHRNSPNGSARRLRAVKKETGHKGITDKMMRESEKKHGDNYVQPPYTIHAVCE